ncbi:MAG: metallophosphoesterase [Clostridia bacterium]|nr:metallophosphoesterase [Clostridia bacterium]
MKKIVVLSDTHGNVRGLRAIEQLFAENDIVIHLGDGCTDMRDYVAENPDKYYILQGNCDFARALPEFVLEVEGVRIFMAHGHQYGVKTDLSRLAYAAKERDCSLALYGHTHQARVTEIGGITCINPGTMRYPLDGGGTYCYLLINGEKFTHVIVGEKLH